MLNGGKAKGENAPQRESTAGVQHLKTQHRKGPKIQRKPGFKSILHPPGRSCFIIYLDSSVPLTQAAFPVAFHIPGPPQTEPRHVVQGLCKRCQGDTAKALLLLRCHHGLAGTCAEGNAAIHTSFPCTRSCLSPQVTDLFLKWLAEVLGWVCFLLAVFIVTSCLSLSLLVLDHMGKSKGSGCQMCLKSVAGGCYPAWQGFLITAVISLPLFQG